MCNVKGVAHKGLSSNTAVALSSTEPLASFSLLFLAFWPANSALLSHVSSSSRKLFFDIRLHLSKKFCKNKKNKIFFNHIRKQWAKKVNKMPVNGQIKYHYKPTYKLAAPDFFSQDLPGTKTGWWIMDSSGGKKHISRWMLIWFCIIHINNVIRWQRVRDVMFSVCFFGPTRSTKSINAALIGANI